MGKRPFALVWKVALLTLFAFFAEFVAYISTSYPAAWRRSQPGMTIAQVWEICGRPGCSCQGDHPDIWKAPCPLVGQWEMLLLYSPEGATPDDTLARTIVVYYCVTEDIGLRVRLAEMPKP